MFKGPKAHAIRARLRDQAAQTVLHQQLNSQLLPFAVPFIVLFYVAGASPMVAMLAGLSVGLLAGGRRLLPGAQGSIFLASSGMLLVACGSQALSWRLALNTYETGVYLLVCTSAVALAFLLVDAGRFTLQWALQRIRR